jgi:hypothetical protein
MAVSTLSISHHFVAFAGQPLNLVVAPVALQTMKAIITESRVNLAVLDLVKFGDCGLLRAR